MLRQPIVHANHSGLKHLLEMAGLFAFVPVGEVGVLGHADLHDQVGHAVLEMRRPGKDALHACWIGRYHSDRGELNASFRNIGIHPVKPFVGDLAGAGSHIRQD